MAIHCKWHQFHFESYKSLNHFTQASKIIARKMVNIKLNLAFAGFLLIASGLGGSTAQAPPNVLLDFWLSFGELLTQDLLTGLTQVQLPSLSLPSRRNLPDQPSQPNSIPIQVQASNPVSGAPEIRTIYVPLQSQAPSAPVAPAPVSAPSPVSWIKPKPKPCADGECLPESVKIVVIDDCNEQQDSSSESDERPIQVYQRRPRPCSKF